MWKCDQRSGQGVLRWSDGSSYEGEWRQDARHGQGTLVMQDGTRYQGEWRGDRYHGRGVLIMKTMYKAQDGKNLMKLFEGLFVDGITPK